MSISHYRPTSHAWLTNLDFIKSPFSMKNNPENEYRYSSVSQFDTFRQSLKVAKTSQTCPHCTMLGSHLNMFGNLWKKLEHLRKMPLTFLLFIQLIQHPLKSQMALNWYQIKTPNMHLSLRLQIPLGWSPRLPRVNVKGCSIYDFLRGGGNKQWIVLNFENVLLQKISVPLPGWILA